MREMTAFSDIREDKLEINKLAGKDLLKLLDNMLYLNQANNFAIILKDIEKIYTFKDYYDHDNHIRFYSAYIGLYENQFYIVWTNKKYQPILITPLLIPVQVHPNEGYLNICSEAQCALRDFIYSNLNYTSYSKYLIHRDDYMVLIFMYYAAIIDEKWFREFNSLIGVYVEDHHNLIYSGVDIIEIHRFLNDFNFNLTWDRILLSTDDLPRIKLMINQAYRLFSDLGMCMEMLYNCVKFNTPRVKEFDDAVKGFTDYYATINSRNLNERLRNKLTTICEDWRFRECIADLNSGINIESESFRFSYGDLKFNPGREFEEFYFEKFKNYIV